MVPEAARSHYQRLQRLQAVVILSVRRAWRRMEAGGNWEEQYRDDVGPKLVALIVAAQIAATRESDNYVAEVLNELDFGPPTEPGVLVPNGIAGWAGDGRPVSTLLEGAVVQAGRSYNAARTAPEAVLSRTAPPGAAEQALLDAERWLEMVTQTVIADSARAAESAAFAPREWVEGYVRMLNPPSCSRCAILAGKWFKWNAGFERHPLCDCVHIPEAEADYRDLTVNPDRYFDSLPSAAELSARHPDLTVKMRREAGLYSQEDVFTKAGAEAIRHGADMGQVVNARRGMRLAQIYGHDVLVTTSGTTRTGVFGHQELQRGGAALLSPEELVTRLTRTGPELRQVKRRRVVHARLMPETIFEIADGDRAEAIRLLKLYGFIF